MSRWICDREWPGSTPARYRSMRAPASSAATTRLWRSTSRSSSCGVCGRGGIRPPAQDDEHDDAERGENQRNELRGGEAHHDAALVASVEFDDEAGNRVEQHVAPE